MKPSVRGPAAYTVGRMGWRVMAVGCASMLLANVLLWSGYDDEGQADLGPLAVAFAAWILSTVGAERRQMWLVAAGITVATAAMVASVPIAHMSARGTVNFDPGFFLWLWSLGAWSVTSWATLVRRLRTLGGWLFRVSTAAQGIAFVTLFPRFSEFSGAVNVALVLGLAIFVVGSLMASLWTVPGADEGRAIAPPDPPRLGSALREKVD